MPEISGFRGVVIGMFFGEHGVPHFHAVYGEHEASIEIEGDAAHGALPPRGMHLAGPWQPHAFAPCLRGAAPDRSIGDLQNSLQLWMNYTYYKL
jgi:hypothetical protein